MISPETAFVAGRSAEKARELLDAAEKAGVDARLVRTVAGGYMVPVELVETEKPQKRRPGRPRKNPLPNEKEE